MFMNTTFTFVRLKMWRLFFFVVLSLLLPRKAFAESNNTAFQLLPDSSNFVTVSLLVTTPTDNLYSVFGHATLRMECPIHQLDYVFTFESDTDVGTFMTGVAGKAIAKYVAVPTQEFLSQVKKEGRGSTQYELALTLHEKQDLWRLLDEDMMRGGFRHFNLLLTNCLSSSMVKVRECLHDEYIDWGEPQFPYTLCNGDSFRYTVRNHPWVEFLFVTVVGTIYDEYTQPDLRLAPEWVVPMMRKAQFVNTKTGARRAMLTGKSETLVEAVVMPKPSVITPMWVFGVLLILAILITVAEHLFKLTFVPRTFDALLLLGQTSLGLLLLFVTFYSEIFGSTWNWYLIVYNPIPALLWLCCRKKQWYRHIWLLYAIVLILFLLATPLLPVLDAPHQFITATMLIRCVNQFFINHKQKS